MFKVKAKDDPSEQLFKGRMKEYSIEAQLATSHKQKPLKRKFQIL